MITAKPKLDVMFIEEFSHRWRIRRMWLFGSVLRADFTPESDVDVMVEFDPAARWSLLDIVDMSDELSNALGRSVDVVERSAVEQSDNYIRRRHALKSAELIYGGTRGGCWISLGPRGRSSSMQKE